VRRFAERTGVPVLRSEQEIKRVLQRYKADRIGIMTEPGKATIYFSAKGRDVKLEIPLVRAGEKLPDKQFMRWTQAGADAEERRRWRVMVLTLKAMLEAIESGIATFDQVFLAHVVMPSTGQTIGATLVPKLSALYAGKTLPSLMAENP
jgi:hypothetical protein